MPIYEYLCEDCGTKFEKLVRAKEEGVACPSCGQNHLKKEFSSFAAHSGSSPGKQNFPACPSGMCRTPEICGRN